jgi:predicted TIM-barrel fold metal-dependent hydrolase
MSGRGPETREADSWFTGEQLSQLTRADDDAALRSPIPTRMVSNGEYVPFPQTQEQREIEARLTVAAEAASKRLGLSRRRFLAGAGGMAAAFIAMNDVFGEFFEVSPFEIFEPAAAAELGVPRDLFVFDDQLHMVRDSQGKAGMALRALTQGAGATSTAAGFAKNPFNQAGLPDELGNPWGAWTSSLGATPNVGADFTLVQFVKDVFLDSQVTVGILSNAPLGLFLPPGESKAIPPRTIQESLDSEILTGYQTVAVRNFVNKIAGSTRLLAHGQLYPGKSNLEFMQQQIDQFHPDSWKGYTVAYSAKNEVDASKGMARWRLDDEAVAYPTYELIAKNRGELAKHPGFFNICIHKGLSTLQPVGPAVDQPQLGNPDDIPKAARDWPQFNFIIYHAAWAPLFFGRISLDSVTGGEMLNGVPDIKWVTRMAQQCAPLKNVYCEMGTTFAATVTTFPTVCAHMIGQLLKYWGPDRIVFGTDSLWYGAPQWQIEAFWRFQIPEKMARQYGYPRLTRDIKSRILGLNSARLYKLPTSATVAPKGIYKPVPKDYAALIPDDLKATLADTPGSKQAYDPAPQQDGFARLKADYLDAGGLRENLRYGWVRPG